MCRLPHSRSQAGFICPSTLFNSSFCQKKKSAQNERNLQVLNPSSAQTGSLRPLHATVLFPAPAAPVRSPLPQEAPCGLQQGRELLIPALPRRFPPPRADYRPHTRGLVFGVTPVRAKPGSCGGSIAPRRAAQDGTGGSDTSAPQGP